MNSFKQHTGTVISLDSSNVDTDQIIPKQFLKRIERTGYEKYLFYNWRYTNGKINKESIFNKPEHEDSTILLARSNFGTGSSREHAVWALENFGIRVIISSSFGDIFYSNCFNNGILPVKLTQHQVDNLFDKVDRNEKYTLTVNLDDNLLLDSEDITYSFEVEPSLRKKLLQGLDNIMETMDNADMIATYERDLPEWYFCR